MSSSQKLSFKEKYRLLLRSVKDIHKLSPWFMASRCVIEIISAADAFIPIYLSGIIIDSISGGKPLAEIIPLIALLVVVGFLVQTSYQCFNKLLQKKFWNLWKGSDITIREKILKMDYAKIEDSSVQRKNDRIRELNENEWGGLYGEAVRLVSQAAFGITSVILALIMTAELFFGSDSPTTGENSVLNLVFPAIIGAVILLIFFENFFYGKALKKKQDFFMSDALARPTRIFNSLLTTCFGVYQSEKDIHIYNQQDYILGKYDSLHDDMCAEYKKLEKLELTNSARVGIIDLMRSLLIYSFVGLKAITGVVSAGSIIKDVQSYFRLINGLTRITGSITGLNDILMKLNILYDFLDLPDEKYMGTLPTEKRDDNEYEFEFRHVYFKYPGSSEYTLKDINLKWCIGEKMALVGKNGCGKSTLVKLLCRLYDPTDGEITLNGIDIKKYDYKEYIDLFSVVFQDSKVFSFSIGENVAASTEYDSQRVEDCINRSGMGNRVSEMKNGIKTCLYKDFDKEGVEISGGEAQKLCLARAVYKGAPFIVLDEPTAALDPVSEYDIYTKFNDIVGTRTAIYISHRLSSCRFCDEITVMDKGRIAERGSHEKLLAEGGVYKMLWTAQSEYYADTAGELFL